MKSQSSPPFQKPTLPLYCTRILVVDDDPDTRALNAEVLMVSGYNVQTAASGADAWQALNTHSYDLLITENKMPTMTGIQLFENLRSKGITLPVILACETEPTEELKRHPELHPDAALLKPIPGDELLATVKNVLHAAESIARGSPVMDMKNDKTPLPGEPTNTFQPAGTDFLKRILVVDDEPMIRQLCTELLSDPGYEVDTAENGAVAWNALQRNDYDLLITDQEMPLVSGLELLKKIHAAHMAVPVIMVSGTLPTAELKQHPELHLDAVLLKPFDIMEFINVVKKVLHTTGKKINHSQLFRDCAMVDNKISQTQKNPITPTRSQINASHRILVVDDDKDSRQLSVDLLADTGYEVEGARDGAAGWEALQTFDYDLVVTDNKMPRMTGVEMIAKLRSARMEIPVIMATGNPPTLEFERRPWLTPDLTLQRPFSDDDLLVAVKKILHPDDGSSGRQSQPLPNGLPL